VAWGLHARTEGYAFEHFVSVRVVHYAFWDRARVLRARAFLLAGCVPAAFAPSTCSSPELRRSSCDERYGAFAIACKTLIRVFFACCSVYQASVQGGDITHSTTMNMTGRTATGGGLLFHAS